jgi:gas vesicle protein GvpL/GvpF
MRTNRIYLYGIMRPGVALDLQAVRVLSAGRVAAVVGPCNEPDPILPSRAELQRHQGVIERAMRVGTIVPFAFGHVARSEGEILRLLRVHENSFCQELDRLDGKVQMGLRVSWAVDNIFQYIIDGDRELAGYCNRLFSPPAVPTVAERIELGQAFEQRRESERDRIAAEIVAAFSGEPVAVRALPVHGEKTVADLTFLIARDEQSRFEENVRRLTESWPAECEFRMTGPWPPYNFVELRLPGSGGGGD